MLISSIDLMNGKAVQLRRGRDKVLEIDNPLELARRFDRCGEVAVIDLDAALDQGSNAGLVRQLLGAAQCRVGGGIRTVAAAREWISRGAAKVIVGSAAFTTDGLDHDFLNELVRAVEPHRLIIAVDFQDGCIVTGGWRRKTSLDLFQAISGLSAYGVGLLCTAVENEGGEGGLDMALLEKIRQTSSNPVTVAGGAVRCEEVAAAAALDMDVQAGMALYNERLDPAAAFLASLDWREELLPGIVQDEAGRVLTLAYSSRDSLRRTFDTGCIWHYSRSRRRLWQKGESSGHIQELIRVRTDCDRDTLLFTVRPRGPACHTGAPSCFGENRFTLQDLLAVIRDRLRHPQAGSYTASLSEVLLAEKIWEEAGEVIAARGRDEIIWEAADLLYFLTVLLAKNDVATDDVLAELRRRRLQ